MIREYKTIEEVSEQLVLAKRVENARLDELCEVKLSDGSVRPCRVIEINGGDVLLQLLGSADGIDPSESRVRFTSHGTELAVSPHMLGRIFNGMGRLTDGGVRLIPEMTLDINGAPINPVARLRPDEIITTGVSAIDGLYPLAKGQKLSIISGAGLPEIDLAAFLAANARIGEDEKRPAVVFAAMGITFEDAERFVSEIKKSGAIDRSVLFMNLASDPSAERILTPRVALTAAEYLAFERDMDVLVIITDMTGYADALRELSSARGGNKSSSELGSYGYLYSDLASICERAGRKKGSDGSITLLPILSLPSDDTTRPLPDIMNQITEGQITLSRELFRNGFNPPIDPLACASKYISMVGESKTREDNAELSDALLDSYARGREARAISASRGEEALTELEKAYISFADEFEKSYINQEFSERRSMSETLELGRTLLAKYFPSK